MRSRRQAQGFTLIELVMVMVLLGIMATFTSQFIIIGTQIYGDASHREQLMSDARFAMERLNRELRDAVPGSVRVEDSSGNLVAQGSCLRFWPIATASSYLGSAVSNGLSIVAPTTAPKVNDQAVVYPLADSGTLEQGCLQGSCTAKVTAVSNSLNGVQALTLSNGLAKDSPAKRIYFADQQVRYCVTGTTLTRTRAAIGANFSGNTPALMAEHIQPAAYYFYRDDAAFSLSEVGLRLAFERGDEVVRFNHKLEVLNVP